MHYDFFMATNDIIDNLGHGNIQFSNSAIGWTLKNQYRFSDKFRLETKVHTNVILWGTSMYIGDSYIDDYWVPIGYNRSTFGIGENIKLSFSFIHDRAGKLNFNFHGYHIFAIPVTENHSKGNVFFIHSSLSYEFPLGNKINIGAKGTFWGLFGKYDSAEDVNRSLISNCLYVRFVF